MGPIQPDDLRFNKFGLSTQESRVLALAMSGRIDKMIASEMGISLGTVRVYWKRIRMKVGGTRSEAIANLARSSLKLDFEDAQSRSGQFQREMEAMQVRERGLKVYEAAFEVMPMPIAVLDAPVGRILKANSKFAAAHGFGDANELTDSLASNLMEASEIAKFERAAKKAYREGRSYEATAGRRKKDGTRFSTKVNMTGNGETWVLTVAEG